MKKEKGIKAFLKKLFSGKTLVQQNAEKIINVVEVIKKGVESPGLNFLVVASENKWDDGLLEKIKKAIPLVSNRMRDINELNMCILQDAPTKRIECVVNKLKGVTKDQKNKFYLELATMILKQILTEMGVKKTEAEVTRMVQVYYDEMKLEREMV